MITEAGTSTGPSSSKPISRIKRFLAASVEEPLVLPSDRSDGLPLGVTLGTAVELAPADALGGVADVDPEPAAADEPAAGCEFGGDVEPGGVGVASRPWAETVSAALSV
jgi:hypothetical protein